MIENDEEEHPSYDGVWDDWGDSDIGIVHPPDDDDFGYLAEPFGSSDDDEGDSFGGEDPDPEDGPAATDAHRDEKLTNFFNLNLF